MICSLETCEGILQVCRSVAICCRELSTENVVTIINIRKIGHTSFFEKKAEYCETCDGILLICRSVIAHIVENYLLKMLLPLPIFEKLDVF